MDIVQNTEDAVALVELQVVEVVGLRRGEQGEVIAGMSIEGGHQGKRVPQPGRCDVRAADERAEHGPEQVGDDVLERVSVERGEGHGRGPLVVLLVNVRVNLKSKRKNTMTRKKDIQYSILGKL